MMSQNRRVVVTGIGAVTPLGNNTADTWQKMKSGRNGIAPITHFNTDNFKAKLGAEVKGFDPKEYLEVNEVLRTDRFAQFAVRVYGCGMNFEHPEETALRGIEAHEAFLREIGMPLTLRELGIENADIPALAAHTKKTNPDGTWVYFLDCSTEHQAVRSLLMVSILVGLGGLLVMGLFVYFMSRKAMAPLRESVERQKRFITDAGHELKTPLAVIGTNMDILEMDIGKNEWVDGTKKQLSRLRKLVANLISLSRLEEMQEKLELEPFDLSGAAAECVDAFSGPAELAGKTLSAELEDHLTALGDVMTAGQLLTILCDNAVKYSTGDIQVRLYASGRRVIFETENDWDHRLPPEELSKLFDRFYRGDASRSGEGGKTGYGLGLSIAKAIAEKNHAQLTAEENELGHILFRASFRRDRS